MGQRDEIIEALKASLEGITIANGFGFDVDTVDHVLKEFDEVKPGEMPYIGIAPDPRTSTTYQYTPTDLVIATFRIVVLGHMSELPGLAKLDALSLMEIGVLKRIQFDFRADNNAIDTKVIDSTTDEGDPHNPPHKPVGSILFTVECSYEFSLL